MTTQAWLPLNEYSAKYGISMSTLRRRIRNNEVITRFVDGKYLLQDRPIPKHMKFIPHDPSEVSNEVSNKDEAALLGELKATYIKVLQEKEAQILQLRNEISDLKTLASILESENVRLKSNLGESAPIDSWLDKNF